MARVISFLNLKGGVGKTFTAYNMAYELDKRGYKVLVLDNDKQGNISKAFGAYSTSGICGAARLLIGDWEKPEEIIRRTDTRYGAIDIIPANMSLLPATYQITNDQSAEQCFSYRKLLYAYLEYYGANTVYGKYDYIIIDNPPDIALNVVNALAITDEIIIPVKIDEWALEGLDIVADQIDDARRIKPDIKILGALVTMYRNNDTNIAGLEWLEKKSPVKMLGKIRYTDKAAESTFFGKPVYDYSPRCGAAQDYKKLVTEYLERKGR